MAHFGQANLAFCSVEPNSERFGACVCACVWPTFATDAHRLVAMNGDIEPSAVCLPRGKAVLE